MLDVRPVQGRRQGALGAAVVGQAVYYAGWITMVFVESVAWSTMGAVLGFAVFTGGGIGWALWQASRTRPGDVLRGPVLRATRWLLTTQRWSMFVVAVVVGGPPGVAAASVASGRRDTRRLVVLGALGYSVLWGAFHLLRPQGELPVHWGPRLSALTG